MTPNQLQPLADDSVGQGRSGGTLSRAWRIARRSMPLILAAAIAGLVAGAAVGAIRQRTYTAEAILAVSPISQTDTQYRGLSVLQDTGQATGDVETLARLVTTPPVAVEAKRLASERGDPNALLGRVTATPIGGSSLVSVRARGASADAAAKLANGFSQGIEVVLDQRLAAEAATMSQRLNAQLAGVNLSQASRTLINARLGELAAASAAGDPTVSIQTAATPPASASSAGPFRLGVIGALAGVVIGFLVALALDAGGRRIRSADQVEDRLGLRVLGSLPAGRGHDDIGETDALRLGLRLLDRARAQDRSAVGVAGLRASDGASGIARRLASSLTAAGHDIALVSRGRPMREGAPEDGRPDDVGRGTFAVVDLPSLEGGGSALRAARRVGAVAIVARRVSASLQDLRNAVELLSSSGIEVLGLVLVEGRVPQTAALEPRHDPSPARSQPDQVPASGNVAVD